MAAPKNPKSLKNRIDALFDALGLEESDRPSTGEIRSQLSQFAVLAEKLEDGQAAAEKESTIAALETELGNLKVELEAAKTAIDGFEAERKKQEEKEREINPVQFQILNLLPSPSGTNWLRSDEIARALKIQLDEADAYIDGLERLGFIIFHHHEPGGGGWRRTESGNTLAVAKRWAGDKEEERKIYKHANLPQTQHDILLLIARDQDESDDPTYEGMNENEILSKMGIRKTALRRNLRLLLEAGTATDGSDQDIPVSDYGAGSSWVLLPKGEEYLDERGLL